VTERELARGAARRLAIIRHVHVSPFTRARTRKGIHGERVPTHGASRHRLIPSSCVLSGLSTGAAPPGRMTARRQHLSGPPACVCQRSSSAKAHIAQSWIA